MKLKLIYGIQCMSLSHTHTAALFFNEEMPFNLFTVRDCLIENIESKQYGIVSDETDKVGRSRRS